MALPDIKDAGLLAHFEIWGWPYHGLCSSGVIDLAGSLTKTITTPQHGSAWLIDRNLDPIVRTSGQLTVDASLGHEWRNYGLISGGVVHGTQLGANKFIHVDEAGERWLITVGTHTVGLTTNQVGLRFTIVQFGLFGEGVKTPIVVDKIVSCHDITYSMYGYTYEGSEVLLEDVWTNGSKAIVSYGLTRTSTPSLKDLFSVMEVVITGPGGADGSGLVIAASEVLQDTQLSQSIIGAVDGSTPINHTVSGSGSYAGTAPNYAVQWDTNGVYWQTVATIDDGRGGSTGSLAYNSVDSFTYARFAFYDAAGQVKAARIKKMMRTQNTKTGTSYSSEGGMVSNNISCTGVTVPDTYFHDDAALIANTTCLEEYSYGIYLMENDTVIDYLEVHQSVTITQNWKQRVSPIPPAPSFTFVCDEWDILDYGSVGGGIYQKALHPATWNAAEWRGTLSGSLGLPAAPDIRDGWEEPMALDDLVLAWRSKSSNYLASGSAAVIGTVELGIQRIDAKAAAFYKPGTTRTYGTVMTPLGNKTASLTTAGNLYFAWQRKTGDFAFSANPICYV